jgi:hypothetical protein
MSRGDTFTLLVALVVSTSTLSSAANSAAILIQAALTSAYMSVLGGQARLLQTKPIRRTSPITRRRRPRVCSDVNTSDH